MLSSIRVSFIAALLLIVPAIAQTTQPAESPEVQKVRGAARAFLVAMAQDDPSVVKAKFAGTADDYKLVEQMHGMLSAAKHLRTAAEARWPRTFAEGRDNGIADAKSMIEKLDREEITITDDTAVFHGGLTLKQTKGQWQVVDLMNDPNKRPTMTKMLSLLAKAADETAQEVDAGTYPDFTAARTGMGMKIRKMLAAEATTKPGE